jgi:hypothetical protein
MSPYVGMDNNPVLLNDPLGLSTDDWVKGQDGIIRWDSGANAGNVEERWGKGSSIVNVGHLVQISRLKEKDITLLEGGQYQLKDGTIHQAGDFANDGTSRELSFKEPQISQDDYGQTNIDAEFSSNKAVEYAPMEVALQGQISDQVESNLRDIKFDQYLKDFNNQIDKLEMIFVGTTYTLLSGGLLIEGGGLMYGQLAGEYGVTAQVGAWYRVGNTLADATNQAINISVNGGEWNYGSTIGNLAFSNPFASAAPGSLYTAINDKNIHQNIKSHCGNYLISVAGNYVSGGIGKINPQFMSGGMKHGISGFGAPLLINSATGGALNFKTK